MSPMPFGDESTRDLLILVGIYKPTLSPMPFGDESTRDKNYERKPGGHVIRSPMPFGDESTRDHLGPFNGQ